MSRRLPIVSTIVVLLAALLMVRLGFWQLHRLGEKEMLLARYAANETRPPAPLAALYPASDADLFRRTSGWCLAVTGWQVEAGRDHAGHPGWRHIALCRTGAEGPGFAADVGVSQSDTPPVGWKGGAVSGRLSWLPNHLPLVSLMMGARPPRVPMIVAEQPAPGLAASAQPDPSSIPNNHLSYAVQWFIFAALALVIYGVALWRRGRSVAQERRRR